MSWHGVPIPFTGRDEWLEKRREGVGGSDVAGILNLSPWSSPFRVWADKVEGVEADVTEAMDWGKTLEDIVIDRWEQTSGMYAADRQWLVRHPEHEWCMATVDALAFESPVEPDLDDDEFDPLGLVEAKTDGGWGTWKDGVPDHVQIQCTWQMFVTGLRIVWVPVLHGGRRFEVYEVEYDEHLAQVIFDRVRAFRRDHILTGVAPDPDDSTVTADVIRGLWPEASDGVEIELSKDMAADLESLRGWKRAKSEAEKEIRRLEGRLKVAMQEAEVGTVGGIPVVTWKNVHRDGYVVQPTDFRMLSLKKEKKDG